MKDAEQRLKTSWDANADAWTAAVREGRIASRRAGTDAAILDALCGLEPRPTAVLDVGCGEGWLVRALALHGIRAVGVDGSAALVEAARARGGTFHHLTYSEIESGAPLTGGPFDVAVCNFALLGADVEKLLAALRGGTTPGGFLVMQTLHPLAGGDAPYVAGWREETFDAFGGAFPSTMPWYFRTFSDWAAVLRAAGWALETVREPLHPETQRPLSLLLVARNPA